MIRISDRKCIEMAAFIGASYCFDLKMNGLPAKFKCFRAFLNRIPTGYLIPSWWLLIDRSDLLASEEDEIAPTSQCA